MPNVYALGGASGSVTVFRQQVRATNLVAILRTEEVIKRESEILVVGGGIAGMTVATGAAMCDAKVTLVDEQHELASRFRATDHRILHPRILDWPDPAAGLIKTQELPMFSWGAGTGRSICQHWDREWESFQKNLKEPITEQLGRTCVSLDESAGNRVTAELDSGGGEIETEDFDLVVLCTGFGTEEFAPKYWDGDDLGTPNERSWLVVGTGDGGAIDTFRLCLKNFDIRHALQLVSEVTTQSERESVAAYEASAQETNPAQPRTEFYRSALNCTLLTELSDRLRTDTKVTLIGRQPSPLESSAPLNTFLLAHLEELDAFQYEEDTLDFEAWPSAEFENGFVPENTDSLVVRIGPTPATLPLGQLSGFVEGVDEPLWNTEQFRVRFAMEKAAEVPVGQTYDSRPGWAGLKYLSTRRIEALLEEEVSNMSRRSQLAYFKDHGQVGAVDPVEGTVFEMESVQLAVGAIAFSDGGPDDGWVQFDDPVLLAQAAVWDQDDVTHLWLVGSADNWIAGEPLLAPEAPSRSDPGALTGLVARVVGRDSDTQADSTAAELFGALEAAAGNPAQRPNLFMYGGVSVIFEVVAIDDDKVLGSLIAIEEP